MVIMVTFRTIFSAFRVFNLTTPTNMQKQCPSRPFTQIESLKDNNGTGNQSTVLLSPIQTPVAEDLRHTHYPAGNITE
jgi:hypothetical protein